MKTHGLSNIVFRLLSVEETFHLETLIHTVLKKAVIVVTFV